MTITDAVGNLRAGRVSSVELVSDALTAIDKAQPSLNAFVTVLPESALARARDLDQRRASGERCGPLCGIPIALKDVFCTAGVRTTCGSKLFEHHTPAHDSAIGERLTEAGAVLVGKTGLHELAYGVTSQNPHFGPIYNPWNPSRIPGGSSGGSGSAVAAGLVFAAMGTDTGGSIRIPAAFCGTVGLKPTSGRVSRFGVLPLDYTLDHVGPLTRSVSDAALILSVIAGHDRRDATSSSRAVDDYTIHSDYSLRGLRCGWPQNFFLDQIESDVRNAIEQVGRLIEGAGAVMTPVDIPDIAAVNLIGRIILMCEAAALFEHHPKSPHLFGNDVRLLLEQGRLLSATDYINAQRVRRVQQREFASIWNQIDFLITPSAPVVAPPVTAQSIRWNDGDEDVRVASTRFARAFNVLGLPAISIPCGFDRTGLPIGVQIVTKAWTESQLLNVAAVIERTLELGELIASQRPD